MLPVPCRLNLGSGQRRYDPAAGWLNVDCQTRPGEVPDVMAWGDNLPFPDETMEIVVIHQVLEHFGCGEADGLVRECHRVLRPDGLLLVFVPDVLEFAKRYVAGKIDDYTFLVNMYGAYHGREEDRHRWGYRIGTLRDYVEKIANWTMVRDFPGPAAIPEGATIALDWWVAGIECMK